MTTTKKSRSRRPSGKRSSRSRASRSHSSRSHLLRRSRSRNGFSNLFGMPLWLNITLGCAALGGLVYGLMQITSVSDVMDPVIHDVGEFFGLTEETGIDTANITSDRTYRGSEVHS